ncbi:hypothetical protein BGZ65_007041 [Modicella reniformis]|uniref:Uncharacterized protein n=1 Tax=Modicella reniformis TaxID=1440133 RepID=A0A9P6LRZ4_9FUNG|nr:hypothetical protein BGZ65_007041 [Modicella reniformis]
MTETTVQNGAGASDHDNDRVALKRKIRTNILEKQAAKTQMKNLTKASPPLQTAEAESPEHTASFYEVPGYEVPPGCGVCPVKIKTKGMCPLCLRCKSTCCIHLVRG